MLLSLDEVVFNQDPAVPLVVPERTLVFKGLLGDVMDPRAPLKQYLLFNDSLFELLVRQKRGLLTARRTEKEEYDFSRMFPLGAKIDLVEIAPSLINNGFTIRNGSSGGNWTVSEEEEEKKSEKVFCFFESYNRSFLCLLLLHKILERGWWR